MRDVEAGRYRFSVPCLQNMPNDSHAVLPATLHFEGRVVDESFTLEKFLDGTDLHGRFSTHISGTPAIAEIYPGQTEQIAVWSKVQALNHPNLLKILSAGSSEWVDLRFTYVVTEHPSEIVAEVLKDRPLDANEAREVLGSVLRGLGALHGIGLVHCAVNPQNIVATEDAVKLTVGPIRSAEDYCTPAFDIWSAGRTVFQSLTQRLPSDQHFFEVSTLPAPFSTILLHCLEEDPKQRWTATDLVQLLSENATKGPAATAGVDSIEKIPAPAKHEPLITPVEAKSSDAAPGRAAEKVDASRHVPKLVIVAVAVFVVALTILLLFRSRSSPTGLPRESTQTTPAAAAPSVAAQQPDNPARSAPSPAAQQRATVTDGTGNWRVIAFTYNSAQGAQHKADSINARDPSMEAQAFSPQPGRYLVSLGGWMNREDAVRLRQKARAHGMPRDVYAQNFRR